MKYRQIVYISSIPWDFSWHRQQEMMSKMAERGYSILFVHPCKKNAPFHYGINQIKSNIWLLDVPGLPYERCLHSVNWLNGKLSRRYIKEAIKICGFEHPIFWFDRVHGVDFDYFAKGRVVIYDLIDEITAFGRIRNEKMLIAIENKILKRADLLISSSQTLLKRKLKQSGRANKTNFFIPNGVDVSRFENAIAWEKATTIPHPRIGFVGDISRRRINFDMVHAIAIAHKDWQFVFVGPGTADNKQDLRSENIHVFNAVSGEEVPRVVASFDIGTIPYNIDKQDMDYVFPRKACEYLAAGIPVVSTPLAEVGLLSPWVQTAQTSKEFEQAIESALKLNDADTRKAEARKYDWEYLLNKVTNWINQN